MFARETGVFSRLFSDVSVRPSSWTLDLRRRQRKPLRRFCGLFSAVGTPDTGYNKGERIFKQFVKLIQKAHLRSGPKPTDVAISRAAGSSGESIVACLRQTTSWEQFASKEEVDNFKACLAGPEEMPTVFRKLVHLASLQKLLERRHRQVFLEWLCCPLKQQCDELQISASATARTQTLPDKWLSVSTYADLIPQDASRAERDLYFTDLAVVVEIVRAQVRYLSEQARQNSGRH